MHLVARSRFSIAATYVGLRRSCKCWQFPTTISELITYCNNNHLKLSDISPIYRSTGQILVALFQTILLFASRRSELRDGIYLQAHLTLRSTSTLL